MHHPAPKLLPQKLEASLHTIPHILLDIKVMPYGTLYPPSLYLTLPRSFSREHWSPISVILKDQTRRWVTEVSQSLYSDSIVKLLCLWFCAPPWLCWSNRTPILSFTNSIKVATFPQNDLRQFIKSNSSNIMKVKPCICITNNQEYFCSVRLYAQVGNKFLDAKLCVKGASLAVVPSACDWQEAPILRR